MKNEGVVLVHGMWLAGWVLKPLAGHLEKAGFNTRFDSYPTVSREPQQNAQAVIDVIRGMDCGRVHLVGHSLGGLLALTALALESDLPHGRVVLLGSPLTGSAAARSLAHLPGGHWLLGESEGLLSGGWRQALHDREIGLIAGSLPLGLGGVVAGLKEPHDGTIALSETRHPALADHLVLPVSHMSMLVSGRVHEQVLHFLREGRFKAET